MDKLKVELFRYRTLVFGKVLHTPDKIRNKGWSEKVLYNLDGYKVATLRMPELNGLCLYVHGSITHRDNYTIYYNYGTEAAADKAIAMFELIIERINKSLEEDENV